MELVLALQPVRGAFPKRSHVQSEAAPPVQRAVRESRPREVPALEIPTPHDDVSPRLVEAARRGEHKAFVAILRHYDRRLRLIAFRLLRDRDLMDDALQDVAIKAFRALPGFRGEASVGTWLYRITYTTCLDYLRRSRPIELFPSDDVPDVAALEPDTADVVTDRDLLERRLATLTPEQRMAVLLVDQEGFDYRTAGEILGVPAGTIGSRLSAAHSTLRRSLAPVYRAKART